MSIGRIFPEASIEAGGRRAKALQITCAECGAVAYFAHQSGKSRKPPVAAQQSFQNKGWVVGSGPRKDFCPEHAQPSARKGNTDMKHPQSAVATAVEAAPRAEAPRTSTVEDRRLINMKLAEVYADGGYVTPWTNQRVADDLGVPRAWVTEIREGFYGPEGSNPLFDKHLVESAGIALHLAQLAEERKVAGEMVKRATEAAAKVRTRCDELEAKVRDVQALGKRVERELGR